MYYRNFVCLKFIILINYNLLIQGTLKIVEELKWKSFTLVVNGDEDGEDDTQNIAKKLTTAAIKNGFCVLISDGDKDGKATIFFFFLINYLLVFSLFFFRFFFLNSF